MPLFSVFASRRFGKGCRNLDPAATTNLDEQMDHSDVPLHEGVMVNAKRPAEEGECFGQLVRSQTDCANTIPLPSTSAPEWSVRERGENCTATNTMRDSGYPSSVQEKEGEVPRAISAELDSEMPVVDGTGNVSSENLRAEMEFSWELYLEEMNAFAVPPSAFQHVAQSMANGLEEGQYLEYAYPPEGTKKRFWYVELLYAQGPEVFVRYLGLEDYPDEAFWLDLQTAGVHAFGDCDRKVYQCHPPKVVQKFRGYLGAEMEKSKKGLPTPAPKLFASKGVPLKDRIARGQLVEVIDDEKPCTVWPAVVKQNIGGRLELEYWKANGDVLWIFCTDKRLQKIQWGLESGFQYCPPDGLDIGEFAISDTLLLVKNFYKQTDFSTVVAGVLSAYSHPPAQFIKGEHVELLHPSPAHLQIVPAVVSEIHGDQTMSVEILDFRLEGNRKKITKICNSQSLDVLPIHWCKKNGVRLSRPAGWKSDDGEFSWQRIVDEYGGTLAVQKSFIHLINLSNPGFQRGMKLEVAHPTEPESLCTGTVVKVLPPLIWIHIDSYGKSCTRILTFDSMEIFPVGFCGSNNYMLNLPRLLAHGRRMATVRSRSQGSLSSPKSPRIYESDLLSRSSDKSAETVTVQINPECYCGPLMSAKKVINLPKYIGPGPVQLVLQWVITSLIGCATRPAKLLQLISASGDNPRSENWERIRIKAKVGGRRQMAFIDVVKNAAQANDFLRNTCILYEACPNLITVKELSASPSSSPRTKCSCHQFVKPDLKNVQIRRRLPRVNTRDSLDDPSSLDTSMIDDVADLDMDMEGSPANDVLKVRMLVGPDDFDEDFEPGDPQNDFDDDVEPVPDSLEPSRAPSEECEPIPDSVVIPSKIKGTKRMVEDDVSQASAIPVKRKRMKRRKINKVEVQVPVPVEEIPPLPPNGGSEVPLSPPSAVEPDTVPILRICEEGSQEAEQLPEEAKGSAENVENHPVHPILVDDSEYLMYFIKHPKEWTTDETFSFLRRHLPQSDAPDILREEEIDGDALLMMCASDLRYLRIPTSDVVYVASLIERIIFSLLITKGERVPLYANWK